MRSVDIKDGEAGLVTLPRKPGFMDDVRYFISQNRGLIIGGAVALAAALLFSRSDMGGKVMTQLTLAFQKVIGRPAEILSALLPSGHGAEATFIETIWLLLMSVVMVPFVCRVLPGATPVLGFLVRLQIP